MSGYGSWAPLPPLEYAAPERPGLRTDALQAALWVGGLTIAGVVFSFATRWIWYDYTFTFRVSWVYVPVAFVAILFLAQLRFPVAAALFYGYLPIGQAAHAQNFLIGDVNAALTYEMVLALPLILAGALGTPGSAGLPRRPVPMSVKLSLAGFVLAGLVAAMLSSDLPVCLTAWVGRFLLPFLVTIVLVRRLERLEDYRTVWYGLIVGLSAIAVFDYRRAVLGEVESYTDISQRYIGATQSFAIPLLYALGGALWLGVARARRGAVVQSLFWFGLFAGSFLLMWLGASRGPLIGIGLLVLWWLPTLARQLHRPGIILMVLIGSAAGVYFVRDALTRTTLDVQLTLDRLKELQAGGLTGHNRAAIWSQALDLWAQQPIFGLGPNHWVTLDTGFESVHSTWVGLLFDTGVLGAAVFTVFVIAVLRVARRSTAQHLSDLDRAFFLGCRAGWVVMLLILCTNLPFTSGQPRNQIFAYMVFFFPALALVTYQHHGAAGGATPAGPPLPPSITGTAHPRPADFMP